MSSPAAEGRPPQAKVKFIITRFVETEAVHFKSVVQSLTGKESMVAYGDRREPPTVYGGAGSVAGEERVGRLPTEELRLPTLALEELCTFWAGESSSY